MIFLIAAICTARAPAKAAKAAKRIAISTALRACSRRTSVKCRMAKLIVELSLLLVTEDVVRFRDLFELLLRRRISAIRIRVVFLCKLTVCLFDVYSE